MEMKMNVQNDQKRVEKRERAEVDRRDVVRVAEEKQGVWLLGALCR